jgi:NAD(P)H dehydrogenase (quinone)
MSDQSALYRPRHVVVLAHPSPQSFNGLVADAYCRAVKRHGQDAIVRDLYAVGFDPLLKDSERPHDAGTKLSRDVEYELAVLRDTDVFVLVYPIWFGMPPAILKGYLDRVLGAGVTAHHVQDGKAASLLAGKRLISISSSGASRAWLNQQGQLESLHTLMGTYLVKAFGMKSFANLHFGETVDGLAQDFIDPLLGQVENFATKICEAVAAERAGSAVAA